MSHERNGVSERKGSAPIPHRHSSPTIGTGTLERTSSMSIIQGLKPPENKEQLAAIRSADSEVLAIHKKFVKKTINQKLADLTEDTIKSKEVSTVWGVLLPIYEGFAKLTSSEQQRLQELFNYFLGHSIANVKSEGDYVALAEAINHLFQHSQISESISKLSGLNAPDILFNLRKVEKLKNPALSYICYRLALANINNEAEAVNYLSQVDWNSLQWSVLPPNLRITPSQFIKIVNYCVHNLKKNENLLKNLCQHTEIASYITFSQIFSADKDFHDRWYRAVVKYGQEPAVSVAHYRLALSNFKDKKTAVEQLALADWQLLSDINLTALQIIELVKYCNKNDQDCQNVLAKLFQQLKLIDAVVSDQSFKTDQKFQQTWYFLQEKYCSDVKKKQQAIVWLVKRYLKKARATESLGDDTFGFNEIVTFEAESDASVLFLKLDETSAQSFSLQELLQLHKMGSAEIQQSPLLLSSIELAFNGTFRSTITRVNNLPLEYNDIRRKLLEQLNTTYEISDIVIPDITSDQFAEVKDNIIKKIDEIVRKKCIDARVPIDTLEDEMLTITESSQAYKLAQAAVSRRDPGAWERFEQLKKQLGDKRAKLSTLHIEYKEKLDGFGIERKLIIDRLEHLSDLYNGFSKSRKSILALQQTLEQFYAYSHANTKLGSQLGYSLAYSYATFLHGHIPTALKYLAAITPHEKIDTFSWDKATLHVLYKGITDDEAGRSAFTVLIRVILANESKQLREELMMNWLDSAVNNAKENLANIQRAVTEIKICLDFMVDRVIPEYQYFIYRYIAKIFEQYTDVHPSLRSIQQQIADYIIGEKKFVYYVQDSRMPLFNISYTASVDTLPLIITTGRLTPSAVSQVIAGRAGNDKASYKQIAVAVYSGKYFTAEKLVEYLYLPSMPSIQRMTMLEVANTRFNATPQTMPAEQFIIIATKFSEQFVSLSKVDHLNELAALIPMLEQFDAKYLATDQTLSNVIVNCLTGLRNCYLFASQNVKSSSDHKVKVLELLLRLCNILKEKSGDLASQIMLHLFHDQDLFQQLNKDNKMPLLIEKLGANTFLSAIEQLHLELAKLKNGPSTLETISQRSKMEYVLSVASPAIEEHLLHSRPLVSMSTQELTIFLARMGSNTKSANVLKKLLDVGLVNNLTEENLLLLLECVDIENLNDLIETYFQKLLHVREASAKYLYSQEEENNAREKLIRGLLAHTQMTMLKEDILQKRVCDIGLLKVPQIFIEKLADTNKLVVFLNKMFEEVNKYEEVIALFNALPEQNPAKRLLAVAILGSPVYLEKIVEANKNLPDTKELIDCKKRVNYTEFDIAREVSNPLLNTLVTYVDTKELARIKSVYDNSHLYAELSCWFATSVLNNEHHVANSTPDQLQNLVLSFAEPESFYSKISTKTELYFDKSSALLKKYNNQRNLKIDLLRNIYLSIYNLRQEKDNCLVDLLTKYFTAAELIEFLSDERFNSPDPLLNKLKQNETARRALATMKLDRSIKISHGAVWLLIELLTDPKWVNLQDNTLVDLIELVDTNDLLGDYTKGHLKEGVIKAYLGLLETALSVDQTKVVETKAALNKLSKLIFCSDKHMSLLGNYSDRVRSALLYATADTCAVVVRQMTNPAKEADITEDKVKRNLSRTTVNICLDAILGGYRAPKLEKEWCKEIFDTLTLPEIKALFEYYFNRLSVPQLSAWEKTAISTAFRRIASYLISKNALSELFTPERLNQLTSELLDDFFEVITPEVTLVILDQIRNSSCQMTLQKNLFALIINPVVVAKLKHAKLCELIEAYIATFGKDATDKNAKRLEVIIKLRDSIKAYSDNNSTRENAAKTLANYILKMLPPKSGAPSTERTIFERLFSKPEEIGFVTEALDLSDTNSSLFNLDLARMILLRADLFLLNTVNPATINYLVGQARFGNEIEDLKASGGTGTLLEIVALQKMTREIKSMYFPEDIRASSSPGKVIIKQPFTTELAALDACAASLDQESQIKLIMYPDCPQFSEEGYTALLNKFRFENLSPVDIKNLINIIKELASKNSQHKTAKLKAIFGVIIGKKGWQFVRDILSTDVALLTAVLTNGDLLSALSKTQDKLLEDILSTDTFAKAYVAFADNPELKKLINTHVKKNWSTYVNAQSTVHAGFFDYVFHQQELVQWLSQKENMEKEPKILKAIEAARLKNYSAKAFLNAVAVLFSTAKLGKKINELVIDETSSKKHFEIRDGILFCLIPKFLSCYKYNATMGQEAQETEALCELTKAYAKEFRGANLLAIDNIRWHCEKNTDPCVQKAVAEALLGNSVSVETIATAKASCDDKVHGHTKLSKNINSWSPNLVTSLLNNDPKGEILEKIFTKYRDKKNQSQARKAQQYLLNLLKQPLMPLNAAQRTIVKKATTELEWQNIRLNWVFGFGRLIYAIGRGIKLIDQRKYIASAKINDSSAVAADTEQHRKKPITLPAAPTQPVTTDAALRPSVLSPSINGEAPAEISELPNPIYTSLFLALGGTEVSKRIGKNEDPELAAARTSSFSLSPSGKAESA